MPRLTDTVRSALGDWWELVSKESFLGTTVTDTIVLANTMAQLAGRSLAFAESSAISTLYGYGRRMARASEAVINAEDGEFIASNHIAIPPWARDEREQNAYPIWHVSYTFTFVDATGQTQHEYRTSVIDVNFPQTIGELRDWLSEDAQALADKYGVDLLDASLHQILAV